MSKTGANDKNGYKNTFTDAVSTEPVTDRASAIDAYTARMTYGFSQTSPPVQAPSCRKARRTCCSPHSPT